MDYLDRLLGILVSFIVTLAVCLVALIAYGLVVAFEMPGAIVLAVLLFCMLWFFVYQFFFKK